MGRDVKALLSALERGILAAGFAATVATTLLAARNGFAPVQDPLTFGLVYWRWYALLALAVSIPLALSGGVAAWRARRPWIGRLAVGGFAAWVLAMVFLYNGKGLQALVELDGVARYRWLCPGSFVLGVLGLVTVVFASDRWRAVPRVLALLTLGAGLGAFYPASPTPPRPEAGSSAARRSGERLLVVGVDGADWKYVDALIERGELPHFAALKSKGAWGRLRTFQPTRSPIIWTTVITGRKPVVHGVQGFTNPRIRGVNQTLPSLKPVRRLGFEALQDALKRHRRLFEAPVTSHTRRVPAFWNLASAEGSPVAVVAWWATFPTEAVLGAIVSERAYYVPPDPSGTTAEARGLVFPQSLYGEIGRLTMKPSEVSLEKTREFLELTPEEYEAVRAAPPSTRRDIRSSFTYFYSLFETNHRHALHLMEAGRRQWGAVPDTFVLYRLVDMTCHTSLRHSELVRDHVDSPPEDLAAYGRVVTAAYRNVDRALGELMAAFGEGNVVVLSDHGWAMQQEGGGHRDYGHRRAPAGVFLAAGPAIRPGPVEGLSVYETLPLFMRLKGWPVAEDLDGRVPEEVLAEAFRSANPLRRVASYGGRGELGIAVGAGEVDEEMLDRLRALGYIQ